MAARSHQSCHERGDDDLMRLQGAVVQPLCGAPSMVLYVFASCCRLSFCAVFSCSLVRAPFASLSRDSQDAPASRPPPLARPSTHASVRPTRQSLPFPGPPYQTRTALRSQPSPRPFPPAPARPLTVPGRTSPFACPQPPHVPPLQPRLPLTATCTRPEPPSARRHGSRHCPLESQRGHPPRAPPTQVELGTQ